MATLPALIVSAITVYNTLHHLLSSSIHILRAYLVLVNTRLHILFIWYTRVRVRIMFIGVEWVRSDYLLCFEILFNRVFTCVLPSVGIRLVSLSIT